MYKQYPLIVSVFIIGSETNSKYVTFTNVYVGSKRRREPMFYSTTQYLGKKYHFLDLPILGRISISVNNLFSITQLTGSTIRYLKKDKHERFYL